MSSRGFYRGFRGRFRGGSRGKRKRNNQPVENANVREERDDSNDNDSDNQSESVFEDETRLDLFNSSRKSDIPYVGWVHYFSEKDYKRTSPLIGKIIMMEKFIERSGLCFSAENIEGTAPFYIELKQFECDNQLLEDWPDFIDDLHNDPTTVLNCLSLAVHQTIYERYIKDEKSSTEVNPIIKVKILNYRPIVPLKDLKMQMYGKMVTTTGCVIRVLRIKHVATWIVFACANCKLKTVKKQVDGLYTCPTKCDNCGTKKFNPHLESQYTKTVPFQVITIQEDFSDEEERGRMPRNIDVELQDNLVNTCMPGDDITVTGIFKKHSDDSSKAKTSKGIQSSEFTLYIEAITVTSNKSKTKSKTNEFTEEDFKQIQRIKDNENILNLLIRSLCPSIFGHEIVKLGLLLSLFGGSNKHANLRDDIHVLIIGDPGLGKSQMLQSVSRVASKGAFISGNSSTASGLTVTLQREAGTGDFALEPGALVLADKGFCCIDEFDKMQNQHQALLEAMEQQTVSVAKSGVLWCLPARTSIIAAANPTKGHYDKFKTLTENINMSQPLLSRFDLVFLVLDNPDTNFDNMLVGHVMQMHSGKNHRDDSGLSRNIPNTQRSVDDQFQDILSSEEVIPLTILRKYIAYARQWVKPKLSEPAANILLQFYLDLRQNYKMVCGVPVFSRQLEALIRLTEARAKLELREQCTADDAMQVVDLVKQTIIKSAETVPLTMVNNDNGRMSKNKVKVFLNSLKNEVSKANKKIFSVTELFEIVSENRIKIDDFSSFIHKLNEEGFLIKKGVDQYQVLLNY